MELARRYAMPMLLIGLLLAGWYGWAAWSRNSHIFTVSAGPVGKDHAERRCAKRGSVARMVHDERPGQVTYRCAKQS
jgi:hypothetical protein